jgi:cytochrome c-type biogenesis protein CcmH/NrfG
MDPLGRAVEAFQEQNFKKAIMQLSQIVMDEPHNWAARFYLAMSYVADGDSKNGLRHFYKIYLECPDEALRQKAKEILPDAAVKIADDERKGDDTYDPYTR